MSANVVNNGLCGYYQHTRNTLKFTNKNLKNKLTFPDGGLCGNLWESGSLCAEMHNFFLRNPNGVSAVAYLDSQSLSIGTRISINCISWLGNDIMHMKQLFGSNDDEKMLSIDFPRIYNRPVEIFGEFVVSHLSFYKQEEDKAFRDIHIPLLIKQYKRKARQELAR